MFELQGSNEEEAFAKNEKLLKELIKRSDEQEAWFENFYKEHNISKEEIFTFLSDPRNFDEKTWEAMQKMRLKFQEEIQRELDNIKDPLKTKKTYNELHNSKRWIPI